jgi:hypothetical protein
MTGPSPYRTSGIGRRDPRDDNAPRGGTRRGLAMSAFDHDPTPSASAAKLVIRVLSLLRHVSVGGLVALFAGIGGFDPKTVATMSAGQQILATLCGILVAVASAWAGGVAYVMLVTYATDLLPWAGRLAIAVLAALAYLSLACIALHDFGARDGHADLIRRQRGGRIAGGLGRKSALALSWLAVILLLAWMSRDATGLQILGASIDRDLKREHGRQTLKNIRDIAAEHAPRIEQRNQALQNAIHATAIARQAPMQFPGPNNAAIPAAMNARDVPAQTRAAFTKQEQNLGQQRDSAKRLRHLHNIGHHDCKAPCAEVSSGRKRAEPRQARAKAGQQDVPQIVVKTQALAAAVEHEESARRAHADALAARDTATAAAAKVEPAIELHDRLEHLHLLTSRPGSWAVLFCLQAVIAFVLALPLILGLYMRRQPARTVAAVAIEAAIRETLHKDAIDEQRLPDPEAFVPPRPPKPPGE